MKVSPKSAGPLTALVLSLILSLVMSFTMVAINLGFSEHFIGAWLRVWGIGFLIGFPTALLISPVVRKFIAGMTRG